MKKLILYVYLSTACFWGLNGSISAQQVSREIAISAYIYNFAKNIQWQNEDSINEFHFLIIGQDENILHELITLSKTKTIRNKPIRVTSATTLSDINNVQLVFATKGNEENLVNLFDRIEGKNILMVSDNYQNKQIVMINFIDSKEGNLLFEINKANIINQHLGIMQDMILLGGTEIDVAELYREGQQSLRTLQKHTENLENNLAQLKNSISAITKEVEINKDSLNRQTRKIREQQRILDNQSLLLNQREKELGIKIQQISEQRRVFDQQSEKLRALSADVNEGSQLLLRQREEIESQEYQIKNQTDILKTQSSTIHRQRNLMYLLAIITILVVFLVLTIYYAFKNKQKHNRELKQKVNERTYELSLLNEQLRVELDERLLAQEEIKILNQTLEERVAERTAQLASINKELESFSYSISHDLRAPLRAIFGFSQILTNRHRASLNEEGQQYMNYIVQASVRMEHLINDLLDYSRLGRKSIDIYPVSLNKIIDNIYSDFKQKLENVGATFFVDKEIPEIYGNESLLQQIFTNLIDNAVIYRRKDEPLEIKINYDQDAKGITLKISDNGIGIPEEYWDKIFNIFQRLHSEDEYPGTGIGLATVRKSVSMLNGTIWVESVVNRGTTFFIHLPKSKI
ncbi:MAG: hypothetical protein A2X13_02190 [Bacteroidetes bacterium GWC2_33_15]|nr:MAG: hypothetical protein A2X10_07435 [Bacteroidetes bacterium GWA2_33_15]OFX52285.1 MAG: hypothetical protein A2X13_02190 [Bacteroidetes bacterium GWC2_33_15]OFX64439.1 MAG: hypothetical protein A2X15_13010 [Bacteroidetes bacterium GWB2_32_14]OFX67844.1 MAG: hypothetical protein A2X14_06835 [Bacteroidetes bacterium GWD2_33_33]HAN19462.1 hypothetical protein [Bacteroidales bacterium]